MHEARVKTELWIKAQIRRCDVEFIPAVLVRSGDPDAGAILLKINRFAEGCRVLSQVRTMEGAPAWMAGTGHDPVNEADADDYIRRQIMRDGDLWVLEIEDRDGRYELDGDII